MAPSLRTGTAGALVGGAAIVASLGGSGVARGALYVRATAACIAPSEGSPAETFASVVNLTATAQYPDAYGGALESSCSVLEVYAVTSAVGYHSLVEMVHAAAGGTLPFEVIPTSASYVTLETAMSRVASSSAIRTRRVDVKYAYPDVARGEIVVAVGSGAGPDSVVRQLVQEAASPVKCEVVFVPRSWRATFDPRTTVVRRS